MFDPFFPSHKLPIISRRGFVIASDMTCLPFNLNADVSDKIRETRIFSQSFVYTNRTAFGKTRAVELFLGNLIASDVFLVLFRSDSR